MIGSKLLDYEITRRIKAGGMGVVYEGRRTWGRREKVAVKFLLETLRDDEQIRKRFIREAEILEMLSHPRIVRILGFDADRDAFVMEFVEGPTLSDVLRQDPQAYRQPEQAVRFFSELLDAFDYAHHVVMEINGKAEQGVIHRDIKPSNIMVQAEDGKPKILDFGISRISTFNSTVTDPQMQMGSVAYMSPEQVANPAAVDWRSDIYALGVNLWELVAGKSPYPRITTHEMVVQVQARIRRDVLPSVLNSIRSDVPEDQWPFYFNIDKVIAKATAKNPADRYQRCGEMRDALVNLLALLPSQAVPKQAVKVDVSEAHPTLLPTSGFAPEIGQHVEPAGAITPIPSSSDPVPAKQIAEPVLAVVQSQPLMQEPAAGNATSDTGSENAEKHTIIQTNTGKNKAAKPARSRGRSLLASSEPSSSEPVIPALIVPKVTPASAEPKVETPAPKPVEPQKPVAIPKLIDAVPVPDVPKLADAVKIPDVPKPEPQPVKPEPPVVAKPVLPKPVVSEPILKRTAPEPVTPAVFKPVIAPVSTPKPVVPPVRPPGVQPWIALGVGLVALIVAFVWVSRSGEESTPASSLPPKTVSTQVVAGGSAGGSQSAATATVAKPEATVSPKPIPDQVSLKAISMTGPAYADSCYKAGRQYFTGMGVAKDQKKAAYWYLKAAEAGSLPGQNSLGEAYQNGYGVAKDPKAAVKWYGLAAEKGNAAAQNNLGFMYDVGSGMAEDNKQAVYWYEKAATQNNALGQFNLAIMYENGEGVPKNMTNALRWYKAAARLGDTEARKKLRSLGESW